MFRFPASAVPRAIVLGVLAVGMSPFSVAAPASDEFPVSAAQMQALGVTLLKLDRPGPIPGMTYPARVVLPPNQEQVASAPVNGVVDRLLVGVNQAVAAGQPLLRLSSPAYGELQLKLLEAAGKTGLSRKTLARERQLFSEGIIPERRVLEAELAASSDAARMRQAEAALRLAGADTATLRRIGAGGRLDDGLVLRARSAGVVLAVEVKPGQHVKEADPLVRLANLRELWLDIQVPADRQLKILPKGGEITVNGRDAAAETLSVGAVVGDSQTVILRARVSRGAERLRPGEVVQARVPFAPNEGGWAVPLQSIARQEDRAYVFVRSATGFVATPVAVVSNAGQLVQVTGALRSGQEIAATSVIALKAAWLGKSGGN